MKGDISRSKLSIVIIGSYPDKIGGSLLRQYNIWYSLKDLESPRVIYVPLTKELIHGIRYVIFSDIVIFSGIVSSVYSLSLLLIRRILRKVSIIDFHGLGWYEELITYKSGNLKRLLKRTSVFICEFLSYKMANYVIVASLTLSFILRNIFGPHKSLYVIENCITPIFEKIVNKFKVLDPSQIKKRLHGILGIPNDSHILLSPLPGNYVSNRLAIEALERVIRYFDEKVYIVVTGVKHYNNKSIERIMFTGYLPYVDYVALIIISSGVLLPYPSNAICGGVRNKVLEAGYCKKVVFSTKTGMLYTNARPWIHYYPIDDILMHQDGRTIGTLSITAESKYNSMVEEFKRYIDTRHSYMKFKYNLLKLLLETLRSQSCITRSYKR